MLPNLIKRAVTGLFFVLVMVGGILFSPYLFLALFSVILLLSLREFYALLNKHLNTQINVWLNAIVGVCFLSLVTALQLSLIPFLLLYFSPFLLYFLFLFIRELYNVKTEPLKNLAFTLLGHFYITLPFSLLTLLAFYPIKGDITYKWYMVLSIFIFIWVNDSGAYLVGSKIGKRRLFERISPKKSWEGFWGGVVFAILSAAVFGYYITVIPIYMWMGLAFIVSIAGVFGDLCESMIKRILGVKDSGNILPGHGGMLDRFDAILFAIPAALLYMLLFV